MIFLSLLFTFLEDFVIFSAISHQYGNNSRETCSCFHENEEMVLRLLKLGTQSRSFSMQPLKTRVGLLGVPYNQGTSKQGNGVELAPAIIRQSDLIQGIQEFNPNVDIKDFGDVPTTDLQKTITKVPKNMRNFSGYMPLMNRISERVRDIRDEHRICITLGGDHAIAVG